MANTYDIGDVVTVTGTFTDSATPAVPYDPTGVSCIYEDPSGNEATDVYGVGSVVKASTGVYTLAIALDEAGLWRWRWSGTGTGATAGEGYLLVRPSLVGASTAYLTTQALKTYLAIDGATDDLMLADCISRAQSFIEAETGRQFSYGTAAARYFDYYRDVDGRTLRLDRDLCAITSVVNGDGVTVAAASYVTEPRNETPYYALTLKSSKGLQWTYSTDAENAITVTGKWAYSATPPGDIAQACTRMAAYYYRQREQKQFAVEAFPSIGVVVTPGGTPPDISNIIRKYRRMT